MGVAEFSEWLSFLVMSFKVAELQSLSLEVTKFFYSVFVLANEIVKYIWKISFVGPR